MSHDPMVKIACRMLYPVGQGAFYKERLYLSDGRAMSIVYDCGSATGRSILKKCIDRAFADDKEVDALFLSHFDDDHVNGLPYLLRTCHVKKIYLPLITDADEIDILKLYNLTSMIGRGRTCLPSGYASRSVACSLLKLLRGKGVEDFARDFDLKGDFPAVRFIGLSEDVQDQEAGTVGLDLARQVIKSGENVWGHILNGWELIPHNFRRDIRAHQFRALLNHMRGLRDEPETYFEKPANCAMAKKVFCKGIGRLGKVSGSINGNSMTLYSGPSDATDIVHSCCICGVSNSTWGRFVKNKCGFLYMGDYEAKGPQKWNSIRDGYDEVWNGIGCVQIPHHGSKYNFNSKFGKMNADFFVSYGSNNQFRHPDKVVCALKNLTHITDVSGAVRICHIL